MKRKQVQIEPQFNTPLDLQHVPKDIMELLLQCLEEEIEKVQGEDIIEVEQKREVD